MPRHFEQRLVPYSSEQMFDLVADIEKYPEFLPWCRSARIVSKQDNKMTAALDVGTTLIHDRFTSHVLFEKPFRISVAYGGGPLKSLSNEWRFTPQAEGGCELTFFVDFSFRSRSVSAMISAVFDRAFRKMAQAFETRAQELYG